MRFLFSFLGRKLPWTRTTSGKCYNGTFVEASELPPDSPWRYERDKDATPQTLCLHYVEPGVTESGPCVVCGTRIWLASEATE